MPDSEKLRIDKFLWAVRIFKTRTLASEACRKGRISVKNVQVKPSHTVEPGEIIVVKKLPVTYTYKVLMLNGNRVSASQAGYYILDITPDEEKSKLAISRSSAFGIRPRGLGRPTKKERRTSDRLSDTNNDF